MRIAPDRVQRHGCVVCPLGSLPPGPAPQRAALAPSPWPGAAASPHGGGAALVVLALLGGLTAGGFALAAPVQAWGSQVPASLEAAARKLETARHSLEQGSHATRALTDPGGALPAAPTPPAVSPS
jgi:hypothetical protein